MMCWWRCREYHLKRETSAALIPSTLHWDEVPFRWKRKWWVCLYSSEHALNPQSHSVCRRGKYIWGSMQEDVFSCHCSHQARPCLLQHSWASGVSLEQLQTGEPPAKVRMELLIKVPLTQPSIFWLDGLLWPKQCAPQLILSGVNRISVSQIHMLDANKK